MFYFFLTYTQLMLRDATCLKKHVVAPVTSCEKTVQNHFNVFCPFFFVDLLRENGKYSNDFVICDLKPKG